ncbi:MAG: DUF6498-containing protein [Haliscomenobacter sp.]|uniref:DUF6498-containing protein n=1 Tax=Haliscomenobacter sp. TaxID=2717303 RepID=UPI0029AA56AB|nr:DUF6498-containing protein [Haliscomenobacter sp.]MDX2070333.1 DUF6498-containing protein [Haliscomenobacter sp.]
MKASLIDKPWFNTPTMHPLWMGVIGFLVNLFGLFFLGWKLETVVWLLWFEVIFIVGASLIRAFFALQGKPFFSTLLMRVFWTGAGAFLGIAFIMLTVTFTIKGIDTDSKDNSGVAGLQPQIIVLLVNYLAGLVLNYFANGSFKMAHPAGELMKTFVYLLVLLAIIMPVTMHLLPKYPAWSDSKWVGLAVASAKFLVDMGFNRAGRIKEVQVSSQD